MSTGSSSELLHDAEGAADEAVVEPGAPAEIQARSPLQLFWRRFREDRVAMVSLGVIALLVLVALAAPLIVKLAGVPDPYFQNPDALDVFGVATGPSTAHPFGVDQLGRDIFARTMYGARVSLQVGIIAVGIAVTLGVTLGLLAGYLGGFVDDVIMRFIDSVQAFPGLILALGITAALGPGIGNAMIAIGFVSTPAIARLTRGQVLSLREREFVHAAQVIGASPL